MILDGPFNSLFGIMKLCVYSSLDSLLLYNGKFSPGIKFLFCQTMQWPMKLSAGNGHLIHTKLHVPVIETIMVVWENFTRCIFVQACPPGYIFEYPLHTCIVELKLHGEGREREGGGGGGRKNLTHIVKVEEIIQQNFTTNVGVSLVK